MDSGAIVVGAARRNQPHERWIRSNHGSRVDCYAWGQGIVTAGYGYLKRSVRDPYTHLFDGTSGAAAIIAGCALLVQGFQLRRDRPLFSPGEMRALLSSPSTGTPQGVAVPGRIGVMPDLRAIVERLLATEGGAAGTGSVRSAAGR
jgi:hypothetical protein